MDMRVTVDAYETPEVIGSFAALDVLGNVDGLSPGSVTEVDYR